jgi:hypothetical protein
MVDLVGATGCVPQIRCRSEAKEDGLILKSVRGPEV